MKYQYLNKRTLCKDLKNYSELLSAIATVKHAGVCVLSSDDSKRLKKASDLVMNVYLELDDVLLREDGMMYRHEHDNHDLSDFLTGGPQL